MCESAPEAASTKATAPAPISGNETDPPPATEAALVSVSGLGVEVAGRVLLKDAALRLLPGEVVLLVGPSGAGKSVLLRILTGLIGVQTPEYRLEGSVCIGDVEVIGKQPSSKLRNAFARTGLVFQDQALFDDLDVAENLEFARDHSRSKSAEAAAERAFAFLEQEGIPRRASVTILSGGQRQRVAIARSVAADPELLVYDEPTSALDPRSSRKVAELIAGKSREFGKASLVVSHDYEPFVGLTDRIFFLDPQAQTLVEVAEGRLPGVMAEAKVDEPPVFSPSEGFSDRSKQAAGFLGAAVSGAMEETWAAIAGLVRGAPYLLPIGAKPRWLRHYAWHYARLTFIGSAIPYMIIAGSIIGFVVTYFTFTRLPHGEYFHDEILPALGAGLYRVVIPVLATLLIAGRTGAALASDLGNRVLTKQTLAMRGFGVDEAIYLLGPMLWMNWLGTIVLDLVAFVAATFTSLVVFTLTQPERSPFFWWIYYSEKILPAEGAWLPPKSGWVLAKLTACALVVAATAYRVGAKRKRSGSEVSFGTTSTVYWATVAVLLVHFIFAFFEFDPPGR